ncbi:MAG: tetratricopeptide repeat protein [Deltaproteobacteria bacterium]|nr:tetratricopeptide repeat protein [Deltaproteobacteria bacterium]
MTRVDLHPEELLDAERRGELAPAERVRLDAHAAACAACAFERAASADFEAERLRERPGDEVLAGRIAEATAQAAGAAPLEALAPEHRRPHVGPARLPWSRRLLVAAVMLCATAAAALGGFYVAGRLQPQEPETVAPPSSSPAARPSSPEAPPPAEAPAARHAATHPAASETPPAAPPDEPAPPAVAPAAPEPQRRVRPAASADPAAPPPPGAAELLAAATAARRRADWPGALELFRELRRRFTGTREELVARVTEGRLLLEQLGDPSGALALFDSYLAAGHGGTLAEEALVGRALALGRLGRADDERATWRTLLREFPTSAHAERARARLEELP